MGILAELSLTSSRYLDAAIILAASLLTALLADLFVTKVLRRFVSSTRSDIDDRVVALLHRPVFLTVLIVGAALSIGSLGAPDIFFLILQTLLVFIWGITLMRLSAVLFEAFHRVLPDDSTAGQHFGSLFKNLTVMLLFVFGVMGILSIWKINITPLLASAGIAGAAVAFAAKDTIANFLGGISILVDRPYAIGHFVVIESGERGEVVDIGLRSTRIKTRDDILITIPNSIMANAKIINESAPIKRFRVRIPVGVAYGSDISQVEKILLEVASENPRVEKEPEPRVRFRSFGDSALSFELLCWADEPLNKGRVTHELNSAIYLRFNERGITIPFPQRDVHLVSQDQGQA